MESLYTSYDNKNKKEDLKIRFEKFPGDEKKDKIKKRKKVIHSIIIILILIILFVGSSVLNSYILYGKENNNYKIVNKFDGNFVEISSEGRSDLFEKIGFDVSTEISKFRNFQSYTTTHAVKRKSDNISDSIDVYYDGNDMVVYIVMNLVYDKEDFSISNATTDCNTILKNFVNLSTPKKAISETILNRYYYLRDKESGVEASYELLEEDINKYKITIVIEK